MAYLRKHRERGAIEHARRVKRGEVLAMAEDGKEHGRARAVGHHDVCRVSLDVVVAQ